MASTPRDAVYFARKRRHAEQQIDDIIKRIKRAGTSLTLWQRRARYYADQERTTPEERQAKRDAQRKARESKRKTRAIRVED